MCCSSWEWGGRQSPEQQRHTASLLDWMDFHWQLREIASNMVQLQRALNELSEEHNTAMAQSQEKQQQLEKELHAALQDKVRGPGEWWVPPCSSLTVPPSWGTHHGQAGCSRQEPSCPFLPVHREKLCNCQLP